MPGKNSPGVTFDESGSIDVAALKRALASMPSVWAGTTWMYVEDWLPLGRGGERRSFPSLDAYAEARHRWIRMSSREREAELRAREA